MSITISDFIDTNGYIQLPSCKGYSSSDVDNILTQIIQAIRNKRITFPYKYNRLTTKIESICEMFQNLTMYQPISIVDSPTHTQPYRIVHKSSILREKMKHKRGQYKMHDKVYRRMIWQEQPTDYDTIDQLTDYFTESQRMSAGRIDKKYKTPLDLWEMASSHDIDTMREMLKTAILSDEGLTPRTFRDAFWKTGLEANSFKTTVASSVFWYFDAQRILDISAGWGDRLIAAIAHRAERYVAYDPNISLKSGHDEIIRTFAQDYAHQYEVRYSKFETGDLHDETFDLIFTSPPYFNFEQYVKGSSEQSMDVYPRFNMWFVKFLCASLFKAWAALAVNGNMVIHISDIGDDNQAIVEPMILYVLGYCHCSGFDGVMGTVGYSGKPRPMWVFHKYADETIDMAKKARIELAQYYPGIQSLL